MSGPGATRIGISIWAEAGSRVDGVVPWTAGGAGTTLAGVVAFGLVVTESASVVAVLAGSILTEA